MYVIDFDIVATLLCIFTLYLYYTRKRTSSGQSRRFALIAWIALGSSVFCAASSVAIDGLPYTSPIAVYVLTTIYYLFHNSLPILVVGYVQSIAGAASPSRPRRILVLLPWAISIGLILSNPFTESLFYIDGGSAYRHGPFLVALYGIAISYLVAAYALLLLKKRPKSAKRHPALLVMVLLPIIAIAIQNSVPGLSLEPFAISCSLLFGLLTIQDSKDLMDSPTGLYNREAFTQFLQQRFDQNEPFSILIVHSSELGALQGLTDAKTYDPVVRDFSSWLEEAGGRNAQAFVLDAGLYAMLRRDIDHVDPVGELALRIVGRSEEAWPFGPAEIRLPLQIGILRCPQDARSVPDVLDCIDQLKKPPLSTSNRHLFFRHDFSLDNRGREAAVAMKLREIGYGREPELRFQPLWSLRECRVTAVEVLLGLRLDSGEWAKQSENLRIAERIGSSRAIASLMIERACAFYARNDLAGKGIEQLQIRLVPSLCIELDWPRTIVGLAKVGGMDLTRLCLEITETTVTNTPNLEKDMRILIGQGASFALDDFGSGYSDFREEMAMPFSLIKLDKKIIHAAFDGIKGKQLLEGSIGLFAQIGRKIVAEGVESAEQAEGLTLMGCDYLQGYYFGPPMEGEQFLAMLASR